MKQLTAEGERTADDLAARHGLTKEAVVHMLRAIDAGWGSMAWFDHPEFGGAGQWMQGGMLMLADPLNKVSGVVFTSQHGTVDAAGLRRIEHVDRSDTPGDQPTNTDSVDDISHAIERLAELRQRGLLTEDEFAAKKKELLDRL